MLSHGLGEGTMRKFSVNPSLPLNGVIHRAMEW